MSNDQQIESAIQAAGLTAPRIKPEDLTANIVDTEFVTHVSKGGQVLRWAVLTTRSGYAVVGKPSVAVSPENDNEQIGRQVAYDNARNELWALMGYALKERLAFGGPAKSEQPPANNAHVAPGCEQFSDADVAAVSQKPSMLAAHSLSDLQSYWDRLKALPYSDPRIVIGEGINAMVLDLSTVDAELTLRGSTYGMPRYTVQASPLMPRTKSA